MMELTVIGGGRATGRLLRGARGHPCRSDVRVAVGSPYYVPQVVCLADHCYGFPEEIEEFRRILADSIGVYVAVPPDQTLDCVERFHVPRLFFVLEKPPCTPAQADQMRRYCSDRILVVDHWGFSPVLDILPTFLERAREQFGRMLLVHVEMFERTELSSFNSAAVRASRDVRAEYGYHGLNLLRSRIFPGSSVEPGVFYEGAHQNAPQNISTYNALVGMLRNVPSHLVGRDRAMICMACGKGMHIDRSQFTFLFEGGWVVYDHTKSEVSLWSAQEGRKTALSAPRNAYALVFDALVGRDGSRFQSLEDALRTVEALQSLSGRLLWSVGTYAKGTTPFPEWPVNGISAAQMSESSMRKWMERVGLWQAPGIRCFMRLS